MCSDGALPVLHHLLNVLKSFPNPQAREYDVVNVYRERAQSIRMPREEPLNLGSGGGEGRGPLR